MGIIIKVTLIKCKKNDKNKETKYEIWKTKKKYKRKGNNLNH